MSNGDDMMNALAGLGSVKPDAEWSDRVRLRCHARLAQKRRQATPRVAGIRLLEAVTVAALWLYAAVILRQVAQTLGMGRPLS
jgi:hypothetical protein